MALLTSTQIGDDRLEHDEDDLPPYSETDPSAPSSTSSFPRPPPLAPPPSLSRPEEKNKIPDLESFKSTEPIVLQGPLRILGSIQSTSEASLQHNIHVNGSINADTDISLRHNLFVNGNIECERKVFLFDGVNVVGNVRARYGVEISTMSKDRFINMDTFREVSVGGNINSGVFTLLRGQEMGIKIAGNVSQLGGSISVEGDVQIGKGIDAHGGVVLRSFEHGMVAIGGNTNVNGVMSTEGEVTIENLLLVGILNIEGRLHIKGNLEAKGCVYIKKGSRLIVDGKKWIKGVCKEVNDLTS